MTVRFTLVSIFALAIFTPLEAWSAACISENSGNFSDPDTWTDASCGASNVPGLGDTAEIATGHTITLDGSSEFHVDQLIWEGNATTNSAIQCVSGSTLMVHNWTSTATTDYFADELGGDDGNGGTTHTDAVQTFSELTTHAGSGIHLLMKKGGKYPITGDGTMPSAGTLGSYGRGDAVMYGPRPLINLGSSNTLTHTGSTDVTQYHSEISCGDVLKATAIFDRTSCVAPCAIEAKVDVNHTKLPQFEKLVNGEASDEVRGGADFIMPTTVWDFGDPTSGNWTTGARADSATPWPKNMDVGPVAYHVYETPATYTIKSETRYGSQVANTSTQITITDPETEWPATDTWCFADITGNGGNYLGCPIDTDLDGDCDEDVSQCVNTNDADAALGAANCNIISQSHRCLFRRGDTFELFSQVDVTQTDDWMIGAFGTGAKPIIDMTEGRTIAQTPPVTIGIGIGIEMQADAKNGRFVDLKFIGDGIVNDQKPIYFANFNATEDCQGPEFDNLLISRVDFEDLGNAVNLRGSTSYGQGGAAYLPTCGNDNIVFYESTTKDSTFGKVCTGDGSIPAYHGGVCTTNELCNGSDVCDYACASNTGSGAFGGSCGLDIFLHANSMAVLGGDWANREYDEHGARSKALVDTVIAHSNWGRIGDGTSNAGCGGPRGVLLVRNGQSGNAEAEGYTEDLLASFYTNKFSIHDNHIGTCAANSQALHVEATSNGDDHEHHHSYLVHSNLFNAAGTSDNYPLVDPIVGTTGGYFMASLGGQDVMTANNAFWMNTGAFQAGSTFEGLQINDVKQNSSGQTANTKGQRHYIFNNSFFIPVTNSATVEPIELSPNMEDIFLSNNILVDLDSQSNWIKNDGADNVVQCNGVDTLCNPEQTTNRFDSLITGTGVPELDWFLLNSTYTDVPANKVGIIPNLADTVVADAFLNCRLTAAPWQGLDNSAAATSCFFSAFLSAPFWDNADSSVGMNLAWHRWDNPTTPFANIMKQARSWQASPTTCYSGASDFCGLSDATVPMFCYLGANDGNACNNDGDCTGGTCEIGPGEPDFSACNSIQDSNGYPTTLDGNVCVYTEWFDYAYADSPYPVGTWKLRWDGGGTTPPVFTTNGPITGAPTSFVGNSTTFTVAATGTTGDSVQLGITNLGSPTINNMRLYPPGGFCVSSGDEVRKHQFCSTSRCPSGTCEDAVACGIGDSCVDIDVVMEDPGKYGEVTFHPLWLSRLGQYRLLRFMTWNKTNHSLVEDWDQHKPESFYSYDRNVYWPGEVPVSVMVDLCNDANADCYLNLPSGVTDAHISEYVEYVAYNLNSNLKLYLEYSNETWNSFSQWRLMLRQAQAEPSGFTNTDCTATDSYANRDDCVQDWYGKRTYEMCELAQIEFDAAGRGSDLMCVHARRGSTSGTEVANSLECTRWTANADCYTGVDLDVLAINMYLGGPDSCDKECAVGDLNAGESCSSDSDCDDTVEGDGLGTCEQINTVDDAYADFTADIASKMSTGDGTGSVVEPSQAWRARVTDGLVMVYEGGAGWAASTSVCTDAAIAADSEVNDLYVDALDAWKNLDDQFDILSTTGAPVETFVFFDGGNVMVPNGPAGADFAHRSSNEGLWPKESGIVTWDATSGNDCWWAGCDIGASSPPPSIPSSSPIRGFQSGGGANFTDTTKMDLHTMWSLIGE